MIDHEKKSQASPFKDYKARYDNFIARYPPIVRLLINIIILIHLPLVFLHLVLSEYYKFFRTGYSSKSWPTTEGIIDTSDVKMTFNKHEGRISRKLILRYFYFVLDKQYYSCRIFVGSTIQSDFTRNAQKTVNRYPVGQRTLVYYDPKNPDQAVLEPGINKRMAILCLGFIPFLVLLQYFLFIFQFFVWAMLLYFGSIILLL
jgi:hypothetical protein